MTPAAQLSLGSGGDGQSGRSFFDLFTVAIWPSSTSNISLSCPEAMRGAAFSWFLLPATLLFVSLSRGQNLENGVICRPTLCDLSGVGGECEPGCYCDRSPWDGVTGICMSATDYPAMRPEALLAMYGLHPLRRQ
ncbi:hypothetical protein V5799_006096 [Amblyomma americanum]|uniref:Uncharacterized protein n=1 Tax=Amblyomma americanum TaxID=6943 RepID=A0AAQ4DXD2_AMBAM